MLRATSLLAAIVLLVLSGCSKPTAVTDPVAPAGDARFSDEDRRAARALSVGNVGAVEELANPVDQALLCSMTIEEVDGRIAETHIRLSGEQKAALKQAREIYDRKARKAAGADAPDATIRAARLRLAESHPEPSQRAQIAVGCLRKLVQT